jgi:predicted CXXCH cytochrome family protein
MEWPTILSGVSPAYCNRTFVDTSAAARTNYHYAVSVETSSVAGPLSSTSTTDAPYAAVTTSPPQIPRGLTAQALASGSVLLSWAPVDTPGITGYNVYRATASGTEPVLIGAVDESGVYEYTDSAAVPYTRYWYSVAAVDGSDQPGQRSMEAYVQVRPETPAGTVVPHASFAEAESRRCQLCHAVSGARSESGLLVAESSRALCETCHDGTGAATAVTNELGPEGQLHGDVVDGTLTCTDCHTPHSSGDVTQMGLLLSAGGVTEGNGYCYTCHGENSTLPQGDMRYFEDSSHRSVSAGPGNMVCLNCHESHGSAAGALRRYADPGGCLRCHSDSSGGPEALDILTRVTQSVETSAGHDLVGASPSMSCQTCHSTHSVSAQDPLVDPRNPTPAGRWEGSANDFCFTCHAGAAPAGLEAAPDISGGYASSPHGPAVSSAEHLRPDVGFAQNETLDCIACHESHGAPNALNLRGDVRSKDGTRVQTGLLVVDVPEGGTDLRYWCSACHDVPEAEHPDVPGQTLPGITAFPIDCTGCHSHDAGL